MDKLMINYLSQILEIIKEEKKVHKSNKGKKYNYDCFNNEFFNNFKLLEQIKK